MGPFWDRVSPQTTQAVQWVGYLYLDCFHSTAVSITECQDAVYKLGVFYVLVSKVTGWRLLGSKEVTTKISQRSVGGGHFSCSFGHNAQMVARCPSVFGIQPFSIFVPIYSNFSFGSDSSVTKSYKVMSSANILVNLGCSSNVHYSCNTCGTYIVNQMKNS